MNNINNIVERLIQRNIDIRKPVSIQKIKEFEKIHEIELPAELVEFYTTISNGCKMIDGFQLYSFEDWKFNKDRVGRSFVFNDYWIWENESTGITDYSIIENGIIELIDIGDAQTWNIVVKGKNYGSMWLYCDVGIQPANPMMNFMEWFVFWLDGNSDYFYGFEYK